VADDHLRSRVLEPIAALVGAETGSLRRFGLVNGSAVVLAVVDAGIPGSVRTAYLDRYFEFDPVRPLLARRVGGPLFADPDWSDERAVRVRRTDHRDDFRRYLREFLLPNHFYHHLGFCVQGATHEMIALDFHRAGRLPRFGALERARARVVCGYLQARAGAQQSVVTPRGRAVPHAALTNRETEVADAVAAGLSNKQVADNLGISVRTVENHLRSIFAKWHVPSRTALAAKLRRTSTTFS
jgi:DNA-binding CsgD family transcriptional regulator